jgi:diketogulonate reductase-like aldo/keto reductase
MSSTDTKLTLQSTLTLHHSKGQRTIPHIGLGVFRSLGSVCVSTVLYGIQQSGYRQIDTAQFYENEAEVGEAIIKSGIPREDLFITTKVFHTAGSWEKTYEACKESVIKCSGGVPGGYVDLFLVHSPTGGPAKRKELWTVLEKLQEEGLTKEIGVSNYGIKHLDELFTYCHALPVVNQLELHPWCQQPAIVDYCKKKQIVLQAYSPLVRGRKMDNPVLQEIAKSHNVTPGQVLIRWSLQRGFIPLPKSDKPERLDQNRDVYGFELSAEEMQKLNDFGIGLENGQGAICPYNVHCP